MVTVDSSTHMFIDNTNVDVSCLNRRTKLQLEKKRILVLS